ncbi:hypothetical protein [Clostridium akagii]|uniref:hypothetical protein n=1 Tax=Clostridium akagii TaxID=91623 RepID=UPI000478DA84|nr:hypothetical protein [Clostridium akagii]
MRKKKNNFLTFIFSLLPGAGHMYMGFMKKGVSLMSAFFIIIFISSFLDIGQLLYIVPVLWFYSFFDSINTGYSTDEEFLKVEDNYLFTFDKFMEIDKNMVIKSRFFVGILLLIFGIFLIWKNTMVQLSSVIPQPIFDIMSNIISNLPRFIIGIAIIVVGIKLIIGKKKEDDLNA